MKFVLALTLLVAATGAGRLYADHEALEKDLMDFAKLLPMDDIVDLYANYALNDPEFINLLAYILSEDFKSVQIALQSIPEAHEYLAFLDKSGLKIYEYINRFNDVLGIPHVKPEQAMSKDVVITGGLKGFLADLKKIVPFDKFVEMHYYKMKYSPAWNFFVTRITSTEFGEIIVNFQRTPEFQNTLKSAREANVDVETLGKIICAIHGVKECT